MATILQPARLCLPGARPACAHAAGLLVSLTKAPRCVRARACACVFARAQVRLLGIRHARDDEPVRPLHAPLPACRACTMAAAL
jgi:hypothetical protein